MRENVILTEEIGSQRTSRIQKQKGSNQKEILIKNQNSSPSPLQALFQKSNSVLELFGNFPFANGFKNLTCIRHDLGFSMLQDLGALLG